MTTSSHKRWSPGSRRSSSPPTCPSTASDIARRGSASRLPRRTSRQSSPRVREEGRRTGITPSACSSPGSSGTTSPSFASAGTCRSSSRAWSRPRTRFSRASTARPAVVVSNHGGRQLDGVVASLDALPEVVEAVGDRAEVYLDGGVRRGSDVVTALALGARAVLVGRPAMYGLAFGGAQGRAAGARHPSRRGRERARAPRLPLPGRGDARARHTRVTAVSIAELTQERRPRAARGRARAEARTRPSAAREDRDRRHRAGRHARKRRFLSSAWPRSSGRATSAS